MSILSALGSRPIQSFLPRTSTQDGYALGAQATAANGKLPAPLPVVDPVSLSAGIAQSQQALNARLAQLGDKTIDVAQRFIGTFAQSLFGDAAKGATFSFDAISVSADTSLSASVEHFASAAGTIDSASLQLTESASFVGRGTIVTAEGQSFDFDIEVRYEASVSASQTTTRSAPQEPLKAPDTLALTGKQLPEIKFPGSLADLFKLLGRQLEVSTDSGKSDGNGGNLSLRLIRLVNSAALLAPRAHPENPQATPAERNRALASYAPAPPSSTITTA